MDIMGGVVVRAERGERQHYRPIVSSLCSSSDPVAITRALLGLYPFDMLYIADLDAIMGLGDNLQSIVRLQRQFPQVDFWLDAGIIQLNQLQTMRALGLTCVIGSERLHSLAQYQALQPLENNVVLSLDFGHQGFLGDPALLNDSKHWPERVVCMTLAKVGSYEGVDSDTLSTVQKHAGQHQIYAAGGIRSVADLHTLADKKLAGALIASALHDGLIAQQELAALRLGNF